MVATIDKAATGEVSLLEMPLAWLVEDPANERGALDPADEEMKALANSVRQYGVQEPIRAFQIAPERYMIESGHRRRLAAELAGLAVVPVIVKAAPADEVDQARRRLLANMHRKDINPVQLARSIKTVLEVDAAAGQEKPTQESIGRDLDMSQGQVANLLRMLKLPKEVLAMVEVGQLTASHAREILRIPDDFVEYNWGGKTGRTPEEIRLFYAKQSVHSNYSVNALANVLNNFFENSQRNKKQVEEEAERKRQQKLQSAQQQIEAEERKRQADEKQRKEKEARERQSAKLVEREEIAERAIDQALEDEGTGINIHLVRISVVLAASAAKVVKYDNRAEFFKRVLAMSSVEELVTLLMEVAREGFHLDTEKRELGTYSMDDNAREYVNAVHFVNEAIAFALYNEGQINRTSLTTLLATTKRNPNLQHDPESKAAKLKEVRFVCPTKGCGEKATALVEQGKTATAPTCAGYKHSYGTPKPKMVEEQTNAAEVAA